MEKRPFRPGLIVLGVIAALTLASCAESPGADEESTITIAVPGITVNYDPFDGGHLYWMTSYSNQAVYDPLITRLSSGNGFAYGSWLAEEDELSDDRSTWSVTLRDDVDFIDGEHLTAQGVADYLNAVFASESYLGYATMQRFQPAIIVTGEYTFEIATVTPIDSDFLGTIVLTPIISPAAIDDHESLATKAVGSGPYVVEDLVPDVSMTLVRNPDYWNPEAFDFDKIEVVVYSDYVASLNALKSGQVDAAQLDIPLAVEAEAGGLAVHAGGALTTTLYFGDRAGAIQPAIADVRVRQAINMAFDREAIVESLELGYSLVSSQLVNAGNPEYIDGGDDYYTYDPERARELLAEAGYPDGFELALPGTAGQTAKYEPIVTQALGEIGISVTFEPYAEFTDWYQAFGEYPAILMGAPNDAMLQQFLLPDGPWAKAWNYSDPYVLDLAEVVRTGSADEVAEAEADLGRYVLEQAWFAPISKPQTIWASDPSITVTMGPFFGPDLRDFTIAD